MNKKVFGKKLSRDTTSRRALYRALVRSFVINGKLVTTYSKARVIVPIIENLFVKAKRNTISDRRSVYAFTANDRATADKLFDMAKRVGSVGGGLLKYVNLPARKGDNAPVSRVEFARKIEEKTVTKIETKKTVAETAKGGIFKRKVKSGEKSKVAGKKLLKKNKK